MLQHLSGGVSMKRRGVRKGEGKKRENMKRGEEGGEKKWRIECTIFHMIARCSYTIDRHGAVIACT